MNEQEFSELAERYLDREATAEEVAKLQDLLRQDPAARARFWQAAEWHALYRQWGEQEWGRAAAREEDRVIAMPKAPVAREPRVPRAPRVVSPGKITRFPVFRWAAGIAAAVALIFALTHLPSRVPPVATLERAVGVEWKSAPIKEGSKLKPTQFALSEGAVVLVLNRGARVVVEGPAEVVVKDDNSLKLHSGRLRAWVPPSARGFKVETPDYAAVDLGTEFGCDVLADGSSELHVFTGAVNLRPENSNRGTVQLRQNEAMRVFRGATTSIPPSRLKFLSEGVLNRLDPKMRGDHEAWRLMSQQLDEDPMVVLHYDFQGPLDFGVPNRARSAAMGTTAKILGPQRAEGRWPAKAALRFQSVDDRLEFNLPDAYQSLTLLAWVRVENPPSGRIPLLMSRGNQIGDVHWYIHWNGGVGVGLLTEANESPWNTYHSEPAFLPKDHGKWMFVATVLNGVTGTATHYVNGELVGERAGIARVPLRLSEANMGHYGAIGRKASEGPSHLPGSIDEVTVFRAPLSADDIARLYRLGKPAAH